VIFLVFASVVVILWVGAQDVLAGRMTAGRLGQFVLYAVFAAGGLGELSQVWGEISLAAGAAERIAEILAIAPTIKAPAHPVALPVPANGGVFTYRLPAGTVEPGRRVLVPLGRRNATGVVLGLATSVRGELRDVLRVLDDRPLLPPDVLHLVRWAAAHYLAPLGLAIRGALPPGIDMREELRATEDDLERSASRLMAYVTPRPTPGPTGDFLLFRKRQAVVRKFREMVEGAQREVIVSASEMCVVRGSRFLIDAYRDRAKAGVAIRVSTRITSQNQAAAEVVRREVDVRHTEPGNRGTSILVVDRNEVFICHWNPDDEDLHFGDDVGLWSTNPGVEA